MWLTIVRHFVKINVISGIKWLTRQFCTIVEVPGMKLNQQQKHKNPIPLFILRVRFVGYRPDRAKIVVASLSHSVRQPTMVCFWMSTISHCVYLLGSSETAHYFVDLFRNSIGGHNESQENHG